MLWILTVMYLPTGEIVPNEPDVGLYKTRAQCQYIAHGVEYVTDGLAVAYCAPVLGT